MPYLLDANILARRANSAGVLYPVAGRAVTLLHRRGDVLFITPQNMTEFRNVAPRPKAVNGLGMSAAEADAEAARIEAVFPMLPDTPDIYPAWKAIVDPLGVVGRQVHDARLLAVCHAHGVTHLLTFNVHHFARLVAAGPTVVVVDPAAV